MNYMFVYYNHERMHHVLGPVTVKFAETFDEWYDLQEDRLIALGYTGELPTVTLVEAYTRSALLTGLSKHEKDFVFVNSWTPSGA